MDHDGTFWDAWDAWETAAQTASESMTGPSLSNTGLTRRLRLMDRKLAELGDQLSVLPRLQAQIEKLETSHRTKSPVRIDQPLPSATPRPSTSQKPESPQRCTSRPPKGKSPVQTQTLQPGTSNAPSLAEPQGADPYLTYLFMQAHGTGLEFAIRQQQELQQNLIEAIAQSISSVLHIYAKFWASGQYISGIPTGLAALFPREGLESIKNLYNDMYAGGEPAKNAIRYMATDDGDFNHTLRYVARLRRLNKGDRNPAFNEPASTTPHAPPNDLLSSLGSTPFAASTASTAPFTPARYTDIPSGLNTVNSGTMPDPYHSYHSRHGNPSEIASASRQSTAIAPRSRLYYPPRLARRSDPRRKDIAPATPTKPPVGLAVLRTSQGLSAELSSTAPESSDIPLASSKDKADIVSRAQGGRSPLGQAGDPFTSGPVASAPLKSLPCEVQRTFQQLIVPTQIPIRKEVSQTIRSSTPGSSESAELRTGDSRAMIPNPVLQEAHPITSETVQSPAGPKYDPSWSITFEADQSHVIANVPPVSKRAPLYSEVLQAHTSDTRPSHSKSPDAATIYETQAAPIASRQFALLNAADSQTTRAAPDPIASLIPELAGTPLIGLPCAIQTLWAGPNFPATPAQQVDNTLHLPPPELEYPYESDDLEEQWEEQGYDYESTSSGRSNVDLDRTGKSFSNLLPLSEQRYEGSTSSGTSSGADPDAPSDQEILDETHEERVCPASSGVSYEDPSTTTSSAKKKQEPIYPGMQDVMQLPTSWAAMDEEEEDHPGGFFGPLSTTSCDPIPSGHSDTEGFIPWISSRALRRRGREVGSEFSGRLNRETTTEPTQPIQPAQSNRIEAVVSSSLAREALTKKGGSALEPQKWDMGRFQIAHPSLRPRANSEVAPPPVGPAVLGQQTSIEDEEQEKGLTSEGKERDSRPGNAEKMRQMNAALGGFLTGLLMEQGGGEMPAAVPLGTTKGKGTLADASAELRSGEVPAEVTSKELKGDQPVVAGQDPERLEIWEVAAFTQSPEEAKPVRVEKPINVNSKKGRRVLAKRMKQEDQENKKPE